MYLFGVLTMITNTNTIFKNIPKLAFKLYYEFLFYSSTYCINKSTYVYGSLETHLKHNYPSRTL